MVQNRFYLKVNFALLLWVCSFITGFKVTFFRCLVWLIEKTNRKSWNLCSWGWKFWWWLVSPWVVLLASSCGRMVRWVARVPVGSLLWLCIQAIIDNYDKEKFNVKMDILLLRSYTRFWCSLKKWNFLRDK